MRKGRGLKLAGIIIIALLAAIGLMLFVADFIYYYGINKRLYVELGDQLPVADDFLKKTGEIKYISDISKIDKSMEGKHQIKIDYNGKEKKVYIIIEDTLAPYVEVKDVDVSIYDELEATELITRISDESKVKIEYKKRPKFGTVGRYEAVIEVKDEAGNTTKVVSKVNVCRVKDYVEYKLGDSIPEAASFIFSDKDTGKLLTDIGGMVDKPGTYYVALEIDGKKYKSKLIAVDDEAPVVVGRDVEITMDEIAGNISLMPSDFVYFYSDADDVSMYFIEPPDYTKGLEMDVKVAVADISGNTTIISRKLYVVKYKGFDIELGSNGITDNMITAGLNCKEAVLVSGAVDTSKVGRYPIIVNADGVEQSICVNVVDPDAPCATAVSVALDKKQDIVPSMFVSDVKDTSNVTIAFESEPDKKNRGIQAIRIKLTDEGGNFAYVDTTLHIMYDAVEPELTGVANVTTYIRQKPDYLLGVMAVDDMDGDIAVNVDDSRVNYELPGIYEVVYTATDKSGNITLRTTNVEVKNVTRALVDSMADNILADIVTDSMTITEKAMAAYTYIQDNVRYINQADQSSTEKAAYDGLTLGVGDCFTFASLIEVFIERIGGQTAFVSRDSDTTNHYWELCNLGTGWYHMDATPRNSAFKCFMKTDAEVAAESSYYWVYDRSLYPAVATEVYKQ